MKNKNKEMKIREMPDGTPIKKTRTESFCIYCNVDYKDLNETECSKSVDKLHSLCTIADTTWVVKVRSSSQKKETNGKEKP